MIADETDGLSEADLRIGLRAATQLINRMADVTDSDSRVLIVRMLTSLDPSQPVPDIVGMMSRALDERDELRRRITVALDRLDRLSGESATATILRGQA